MIGKLFNTQLELVSFLNEKGLTKENIVAVYIYKEQHALIYTNDGTVHSK